MRRNVKNFLIKAFSMCLAFILVFPTNLFAMGLDNTKTRKYKASASIMGLAQTDTTGQNDEEVKDQTLLETEITKKETDKYLIEKYARLSKTTGQIEYLIKVHLKDKDEESNDKVTTSFAISKNTDLEDLKLENVSQIHSDNSQVEIKYQEQRPSILYNNDAFETLGVTTDKADLVYYLSAKLSEESLAKIDDKTPSMDLEINIAEAGANLYQDRYALSIDKMEVVGVGAEDIIETLKEKENPTHQVNAIYKEGSSNLLGENPGEITWTDFIHTEDDKEFTTDIKLDEAQDATDSQIKVEFYQANEKGYSLKEDFTKEIPFTESLKLQIPLGYIAKVELRTKVTENKKEYSLNQTKIPNPIYKEEKTEEKSEEDDADPLPEENPKTEESKGTSEEKIIPIDPETNEAVIDHSLVSEDDTDETKSAINLNRDSVINNFKNNEKLNTVVEITINNISSLFSAYNNDEMTYEEFLANLKTQAKDLSKEDFAEIVQGLIAGLNQETYKVANIDEDQLLAEVYEKEEAEEQVTEEDPVTETKEADRKETTNAENDNVETETTEDFRTPEDKIKDNALESFDESLNQAKEASKKPQEDDRSLIDNISEGIKGIFGQSNLAKADKELKAALADEANTLADIQALLHELGSKYELNRKDEAKLMADNEEAIKALIARDADENFNPWLLYALSDSNKAELEKKKYNVITRFDTSTVAGPIKAGQFFNIHLDNQLRVKDPSTLKPIVYNGNVIAEPSYDAKTNTIKYSIKNDITENIQVPLDIPVDYNTANIDLDEDGNFTVTNRISGLGVTDPKNLPAQKVSKNGDKLGLDPSSMSDADLHDTTFFFDPTSTYKVNFDAKSYPVIENGEMKAIDWEITFDGNGQNLNDPALDLMTNFTAVEGSGIKNISGIKLNGQSITPNTDSMGSQFLVNDSKTVSPNQSKSRYVYTFRTEVEEKQENYVLDISGVLTGVLNGKNKTGSVRLVQGGYEKDKVEADTPTRIITTNRVTNKGEFRPNNQIRWVVTEEVSSGDPGSLPLVTRTLSDNQTLESLKVSYYAPNAKTGKIEKVGETQDIKNSYPVNEGSLANTTHKPGTIAVYEYITNIKEKDKNGYSLGDNNISEYEDVDVNIKWSTIQGEYPPAETITLTPKSENGEVATLEVPARKAGDPYEFNVKVPNVKKWEVGADGKATPIEYTLSQKFPPDKTENGKTITYREVNVFYDPHERRFEVRNQILEKTQNKPADITIKKTGNDGKALSGARIQMVGNDKTFEGVTDADGKIVFKNIEPGKYILSEAQAPTGYVRDNGQDTITVHEDGRVSWNTNNLIENVMVAGSNEGQVDRYKSKVVKKEAPDNQTDSSFMNTISYVQYEDGSVVSYIMLKPIANPAGTNGTNKDTRVAIRSENVDIDGIEIYNIEPTVNKGFFRDAIQRGYLASWQDFLDTNLKINIPYRGGTENTTNSSKIKSYLNVNDPYLNKNVAAVDIGQSRFGNDWSFIIKVNGRVSNKDAKAKVTYDWLTKDNTATNWKIENIENIIPSKADRDKEREDEAKVENAELKISNTKAKTHPVKVTKKDKNGKTLAGAEFIMTDSYSNIVKRGKTDSNGVIEFKDLPEGIYELKESNPPEGYKNDEIRFKVTVTKSGQILYEAFDKNGTPLAPGDKYLVGKNQGPSTGGPPSESRIEVLKKSMTLHEKDGYGTKPGVWEEASYESYDFDLELNIRNKRGGDKFTINFDKNWNLSQWTDEMPVIKDGYGNVIARPSMDYKNNVLTYTLTDAVYGKDNVRAKMHVKGVRPSKYYVKNDGIYYFTDTINTGDSVETINTRVDAYLWVFYGTAGQLRYITQNVDTYNAGTPENPQYMMRDVTIYNPDGLHPSGDRIMRIFYGATKDPNPSVLNDKIAPAHKPTKVVVWRVANPNPDNMPISGGVRPSEDKTGTYEHVATFDVEGKDRLNEFKGGINLSFDENRAGPGKAPDLRSMDNVQFKITLPDNNGSGYVIENFYKVTNEKLFRESYTQTIAAYKTRWGNTAGMAQFRPNPNRASSSTGTSVDVVEPNYDLTVFNKKSDKGRFTITKYGKDNGEEKILPQAYFRLADSNGKIVKEDYTSPSGLVTFDDLDPGTYTLTETRAPEGYKPITKAINVIVSPEGKVTFEGDGIGNGGPYTVTTPKAGEITEERLEQPDIFNTNPYPGFMNMSTKLKSTDGNSIIGRIFLNPRQDPTLGQGPNRPTTLVIKHNWATNVDVQVYRYPESNKGSMDTPYLNPTYKASDIEVNKSNYETTIKFPTDKDKRWDGAGYVVVAKADFNDGEQNKYISYQWKSDTDKTVLPAEPNNLGIKRTVPDFPPGALKAVNEKSDTEIIIKKVDEDNPDTLIAGAEFTLLNDKLNKVIAQRTTGKDGLAKFEDLTPGTYYIKETKVPNGYKDPNMRWKVVVDKDKKVTITPQTVKASEEAPKPGENENPETPGDNTEPGNTEPTNPKPEDPITPPADNGLTYSIKNHDKTLVYYNGNFAGRLGSTLRETATDGVFELSVDFDRAYGIANQPTDLKILFDTDRFDIRPAEGSLDGNIYTVSNFDPHHSKGNASYKFTVVPKGIKAGFNGSPITYTEFAGELVYPDHATISASKKTAFNMLDIFKPMTAYAAGTWEKVDLSKSKQRSTRETADIKTQVTEINKAENKYRQVFIINKTGQSIGGPTLNIHAWPENRDIWSSGPNPNLKILKAQVVDSTSTPTNLVNPGRTLTTSVANNKVNGYNRSKITISTPGTYFSGTIAVEVEYTYPDSGAIGLGAYYVRLNGEPEQWAAQQFYSEDEVNKAPEVTYKEIEEESIIPIPAEPIRRANPDMFKGTENVIFEGKTGRKVKVYRQKYVGGKPEGEKEFVRENIITNAQPKIIEYGTKPKVVTREESKNVDQEIKFETTTIVDVNKKKGEKTTVTEGKNGSVTYKYTITYDTSEGLNATRPADWPADAPQASPKTGERVVSYTKEEVPNTKVEPTTEVISIGLGIDPNAVVENGKEEKLTPDGKTKQIVYTITNKKNEAEIYFRKKSESNNADGSSQYLKDAEFELLYKANDQSEFTNVKDANGKDIVARSDANGIFKFTNLKDGTYQVKETKAPTGYIKRKEAVYNFKVEDFKISKVDVNKTKEIKDNSKSNPIDIVNNKATYPYTGGNGVSIGFAIIGTAVMLLALAYFGIYQNDKNRRRSARYKK
ncbi:SpaA isopeptide-forming pilin-related protein [Anaerococcus urinomassiliensis]|uniref:SpaA isopeptide-forming pilin-related protein n=1 Tax=Anaerococcus urinomassiliensis TaxID=1745712 RepID=UPI00093D1B96|nr:SpaA isopeptide-forming pilin-related protein [Anaerococcus urinomassiliensis]